MMFWPGLDKWPPPKEVLIAAAVMAFVVTPLLILIGTVGQILYGVILVSCIALGLRARLRRLNGRTEEFWHSGPED